MYVIYDIYARGDSGVRTPYHRQALSPHISIDRETVAEFCQKYYIKRLAIYGSARRRIRRTSSGPVDRAYCGTADGNRTRAPICGPQDFRPSFVDRGAEQRVLKEWELLQSGHPRPRLLRYNRQDMTHDIHRVERFEIVGPYTLALGFEDGTE